MACTALRGRDRAPRSCTARARRRRRSSAARRIRHRLERRAGPEPGTFPFYVGPAGRGRRAPSIWSHAVAQARAAGALFVDASRRGASRRSAADARLRRRWRSARASTSRRRSICCASMRLQGGYRWLLSALPSASARPRSSSVVLELWFQVPLLKGRSKPPCGSTEQRSRSSGRTTMENFASLLARLRRRADRLSRAADGRRRAARHPRRRAAGSRRAERRVAAAAADVHAWTRSRRSSC